MKGVGRVERNKIKVTQLGQSHTGREKEFSFLSNYTYTCVHFLPYQIRNGNAIVQPATDHQQSILTFCHNPPRNWIIRVASLLSNNLPRVECRLHISLSFAIALYTSDLFVETFHQQQSASITRLCAALKLMIFFVHQVNFYAMIGRVQSHLLHMRVLIDMLLVCKTAHSQMLLTRFCQSINSIMHILFILLLTHFIFF